MGRPRTTSDDDILQAARTLFRERGHAVPTRQIARAAGVSQAVLYQRFPSKNELFFAAMAPAAPDAGELLGTLSPPVDAYLTGVAVRLLKYFEQSMPTVVHLMAHPEFDSTVMGRLHDHVLTGQLVGELAKRLKGFQAQGLIGGVDPEWAAQTFVATLHSVATRHAMSAHTSKRARPMAARIVEVFWKGLAPRR
jgi:AcrR family transcriptional regulator